MGNRFLLDYSGKDNRKQLLNKIIVCVLILLVVSTKIKGGIKYGEKRN